MLWYQVDIQFVDIGKQTLLSIISLYNKSLTWNFVDSCNNHNKARNAKKDALFNSTVTEVKPKNTRGR